ncbi:MAG TPA: hypothetical protein PKY77_03855 [Phycisphaerae bacterium]|nr:hypothetical protein [Phycisphaerae bacterium]HRY70912.1 hypothetical protein [Phycisphaerae bacterium]HSA30149.1 hypothetical protein [Phycisphaerae bacterium]
MAVTVPYYILDRPADAPRLSFLWINIIGCLMTMMIGYAASLAWQRDPAESDGWSGPRNANTVRPPP